MTNIPHHALIERLHTMRAQMLRSKLREWPDVVTDAIAALAALSGEGK